MLRISILMLLLWPVATLAQADTTARYACKQFVEQSLDDPGTADLSSWTAGSVEKLKSGVIRVRFRGRARNAFNALRLVTFECQLKYRAPDNWTAVGMRVF